YCATHSWTIPLTNSHTGNTAPISVRLEPGGTTGEVDAFLNGNNSSTPDHPFTNTDGMDIITYSSTGGFLFISNVHAAELPTTDGNGDNGIKVQGGSGVGSTLQIKAGTNDRLMEVTGSSSTSSETRVTNVSSIAGYYRTGSNVTHLTLVTNNFAASDF